MPSAATDTHIQVLDFVRDCIRKRTVPPTYDEIAAHTGIKSRGNVAKIIDNLVQRRMLNRLPGKARALSLPACASSPTAFLIDPMPEVRRAIAGYAAEHKISEQTAVEEALRAYFVGTSAE